MFKVGSTQLIAFSLILVISHSVTITGTLASGVKGATLSAIDISSYGMNSLIRVKFSVTSGPVLTSAGLKASLDSATDYNSIYLTDFYKMNPNDTDYFDLDAMWSSRDQYINLQKTSSKNTLYLTVFTFDPSYRQSAISYQIDIDHMPPSSTPLCASCTNGESYYSTCQCLNCNYNKIGQICSRLLIQLTNTTTAVYLPSQAYQYFSISNTQSVDLQIVINGGLAQIYIQVQSFDGEVASFYNVGYDDTTQKPATFNFSSGTLKVQAATNSRKLLITLVSLQTYSISATITYSVSTKVSVLVIVMSVLGGVLLIALVVAVICIIKRRNQNLNGRVSSQININNVSVIETRLSAQEIQKYFPVCKYQDILSNKNAAIPHTNSYHEQPTINKLQQTNNKELTSPDCVICLQQINMADLVRVGYCRHVFHGMCLLSWFKKQRNCPYCRKEYSREETINQYNRVKSQHNNRVLEGVELCKYVYSKNSGSHVNIQNIQ